MAVSLAPAFAGVFPLNTIVRLFRLKNLDFRKFIKLHWGKAIAQDYLRHYNDKSSQFDNYCMPCY